MPIREGMTYIIALIRQFGHVDVDDMTLGGITYWSDEQLEEIADRHSYPTLIPLLPKQVVGYSIFSLDAPRHYYGEMNVYTDDVLTVVNQTVFNQNKTPVTTPFQYDDNRGTLTFDTNLSTSDKYFIQGSFINLYEALAELWELKAVQRYDYIPFKGGDNKMDMDVEYNHCIKQMTHYRNLIAKRIPRKKSNKWSIS